MNYDILTREQELRQRNSELDKKKAEIDRLVSQRPKDWLQNRSRDEIVTDPEPETDQFAYLDPEGDVALELGEAVGCEEPSKAKRASNLLKKHKRSEESTKDLLEVIQRLKSENSAFSDEIRSLKSEKVGLERKVERLTKSENRLKALLKEAGQKQTDKEGECESLRRRVEQFERDLKRSESHQKTESVKLIRKEEEIQKLKLELLKAKDDVKEFKQKEHNLKEDTSKKLKLQEKQIHQLVEGFQSQLELIEVLKQQKLHLEAAQLLRYTEEEFMETLEWNPADKESRTETPSSQSPEEKTG